MRKNTALHFGLFKRFAMALLVVAIAFISLPIGMFAAARPRAESVTQEERSGGAAAPRAAIADFELTINYFRGDGKYSEWNMWLWSAAGETITDKNLFEADATIGGKTWRTLTVNISGVEADADGNVIGFIVRTDGWVKDPDGDRFIKATDIVNNKVTLYLITGTSDFYFNEEDAVEAMKESLRKKVKLAFFMDYESVRITTSDPITTASYFKVVDEDGKSIGSLDCSLPAAASVVGTSAATIKVAGLDLSKTYSVIDDPANPDEDINFSKRQVTKNQLFDNEVFNTKYGYDGVLGAEYSAAQTRFTVWSPYASAMKLNIYSAGEGGTATSYDMISGAKGTWTYTLAGDQKNKYYTYTVINGKTSNEVVDPYARSGGKDGKRGMIIDLDATDPEGWDTQNNPVLKSNSAAVIWEAQLRDVTIHESSGVSEANRGKFLGLTETGTKNSKGQATALDYLKELGVTQVHFQPLFDFASVVEDFKVATYNKDGQYNWGYDPLNYNMPEGSYSSDPSDGNTRVNEMKQMIMALHNAGIQVVMDVVYNHVSNAQASNFEKLMPEYFFRMRNDGTYYNGSGCGNETASEHYMFRRFMIDSVKYWTEEYKIDGFRFDLMGLHDITTMNELYDELVKINPDVIVYGEGWTGGESGLAANRQAKLDNAAQTPNIAYFDDVIRDGLKGSYSDIKDTGYVSGKGNSDSAVYVGALGATNNFAANPTQNINYVNCHDNSAIWDKLNASVNADKETVKSMNRLAATSVLTSQGIGFMLAGEEMLRSKPTTKTNSYDNRPNAYLSDPTYYFADNSYKSPDSVNAINWELLDTNTDMVEFYKGLIAIKTTWPQFQLETKAQIDSCVFVNDGNRKDGVAVYAVKDPDSNAYAVVILNNNEKAQKVSVPQGNYDVFVNGNKASAEKLSSFVGNSFTVGGRSAVIMKGELTASDVQSWTYSVDEVKTAEADDSNLGLALGLGIGIPAAVLIAGGAVFGVMYGKKKKGKKDEASDKDEPKAGDKPDDGEAPAEKTEQEQAPAEEQPSTDKSEE